MQNHLFIFHFLIAKTSGTDIVVLYVFFNLVYEEHNIILHSLHNIVSLNISLNVIYAQYS